jgi:Na+-transporting methylmalonyl-CoA/oxaloacetate decarboxylase beta subunit
MLTALLTVSAALLLGALATGELERLARVQARMDEAFL